MPTAPRPLPQATSSSLRRLLLASALAALATALAAGSPALAQDAADDLQPRPQADQVPPDAMPGDQAGRAEPQGDEQIGFEADRLDYQSDADVVTASGNVVLVRGTQSVRAEQIVWNRVTGEIVATGNIRAVDEDGNVVYTDRVELTEELKTGAMQNMLLVLREGGRLAADKAQRLDNERVVLTNAAYTACAVETVDGCPKKPSWRITAVRVIYDPVSKRVRYKGARLELLGLAIPLPLLAHSTSNAAGSGFLVPQVRVSNSNGLELQGRYYMRLAPNRDLTLGAFVYTEVLPMVSAQYRELNELGAYQITGYATHGRRTSVDGSGERVEDFRGYLDANGRFQLDPNWSFTSSVRLTTDRTFLRRYDLSRDDRLRSTANLERIDSDSYFSIAGWATQTLRVDDDQGQVPLALPAIDYRRRIPSVLGGKVELQANSLGIVRSDGQDTQRAFASARWDLRRIMFGGFETTLTALLRGDAYHSDENELTFDPRFRGDPGWETRGVATAAVDVRYPLIGSLLGGTQVLTPRFQIVASPSIRNVEIPNEDSRAIELEDTNLFALNRFPGYDRVEDGVRLVYGVDWQLDRPGWRVKTTVGQSYRLSEEKLFPDGTGLGSRTSDIVGRTNVRFRDLISFTHRFRLDKDNLGVRRNEIDATFGTRRTYLELGYLRLNRDIDEVEGLLDREELRAAGRLAFLRYWSVFGSAVINLTDREEDPSFTSDGFEPLRTRLGFAYADDCLDASVTWRRDYNTTGDARKGNTFLVSVALRNLGLP